MLNGGQIMTYDGIELFCHCGDCQAPSTQHSARREDVSGLLGLDFQLAAGDCLDAPDWIASGSCVPALWQIGPSRERLAELGE